MERDKRKIITVLFIALLFSSCGIKTYSTFGPDYEKTEVYSDLYIDCKLSQVIYDISTTSTVYLDFTSKTNSEIEITSVTGQLKWLIDGRISDSHRTLESIDVGLFKNSRRNVDSTFRIGQVLPIEYKTISKKGNSILFTLEFEDTIPNLIPSDVEKILVELNIRTTIKETGQVNEYKKIVYLDREKHHYFWFLRDC